MTTLSSIKFSDLRDLLKSANVPEDSRVTITFEDDRVGTEISKREKALAAMKKLRGTGNDKLVKTLLDQRKKDMAK
jgi:hypothetical protein